VSVLLCDFSINGIPLEQQQTSLSAVGDWCTERRGGSFRTRLGTECNVENVYKRVVAPPINSIENYLLAFQMYKSQCRKS